MQAPKNNPVFWRSRAELIRELADAGLSTAAIRKRCVAEGYEAPKREAIYRAKSYKTLGRPLASRPSYYHLWKFFLEEYDRAYRAGRLIAITQEMKRLIDVAESCVTQDQTREPITNRRKRKAKR